MNGAIVRTHYRYKRPPRKRPKAAPIEGPAALTIPDKTRKRVAREVSDDTTLPHPVANVKSDRSDGASRIRLAATTFTPSGCEDGRR